MKLKKITLAVMLFTATALLLLYSGLPDGKLHVYALDVGQGDAIFVRTPRGKKLLIDGGPKNIVLERLTEVMNYFDRTIDMVILTHPHADHVDGLVEVLKRYEVRHVLFTGVDYHYSAYEEFMRILYEKNIFFHFPIHTEDYLIEPDVSLDILYPTEYIVGETVDNLNDSSISALITYGNSKILLTGDAEIETENHILKTPADISAQIMKAGHHGSRTATSQMFFSSAQPRAVFIMTGKDNTFEHPHEETLQILKANAVSVDITKNDGTIEYVSDGITWEKR